MLHPDSCVFFIRLGMNNDTLKMHNFLALSSKNHNIVNYKDPFKNLFADRLRNSYSYNNTTTVFHINYA